MEDIDDVQCTCRMYELCTAVGSRVFGLSLFCWFSLFGCKRGFVAFVLSVSFAGSVSLVAQEASLPLFWVCHCAGVLDWFEVDTRVRTTCSFRVVCAFFAATEASVRMAFLSV